MTVEHIIGSIILGCGMVLVLGGIYAILTENRP